MDPIQQLAAKIDSMDTKLTAQALSLARLETYITGMNGGGLSSRVNALEDHTKECPMSDELAQHLEEHTKNRWGKRDTFTVLSIIGIYVKMIWDTINAKP